jgi:hypothetical protein
MADFPQDRFVQKLLKTVISDLNPEKQGLNLHKTGGSLPAEVAVSENILII